jgi:hypothetical protein
MRLLAAVCFFISCLLSACTVSAAKSSSVLEGDVDYYRDVCIL